MGTWKPDAVEKLVQTANKRKFTAYEIVETQKGPFLIMYKRLTAPGERLAYIAEKTSLEGEFLPRDEQPEEIWSRAWDGPREARNAILKYGELYYIDETDEVQF